MAELLDPKARTERGRAIQAEVTGRPAPEPRTLVEEGWRDYVYAEAWDRPALSRRAQYLIAMASAVLLGSEDADLDGIVRGALTNNELTVTELREAALHMGPYGGWPRASRLDRSVSRVIQALGLPDAETDPIRAEPWDPEERDREGAEEFIKVMTFPSGPPASPYLENMHNFVFGEMWRRRALDEPSRRWLTLVGVCASTTEVPIKSHVHAAMASGNCTPVEIQEFVLLFSILHGWPKGSIVQGAAFEMIKKVEAGLPWNG